MTEPHSTNHEPRDQAKMAQVRARRVERADLVRGVMRRQQQASAPGEQVRPLLHEAPRASVPIDAAIPHAMELLGGWWQQQQDLRARLAAEPNARARAKLDSRPELDRALDDEHGAEFLRRLIDDVIRPDNLLASGFGLSDLADRIPTTLSPAARRGFQLAAFAGPGVPFLAVPAVRRATKAMFAEGLEGAGAVRIRAVSDPILGDRAAEAERARILALLADAAEVEFDWSVLEPNPTGWDFAGAVTRASGQLTTLLTAAAELPQRPLVLVRATDSATIELAVETLLRAAQAAPTARVGIALPADLPESATLLRRLTGRLHLLREGGGAPVRVAVVRMPDRLAERAAALREGYPVATYATEDDVDANAVRLIDALLDANNRDVLELEVDSAVPMDAALAVSLAAVRGQPVHVIGADLPGIAALPRAVRVPDGAGWRPAAPYLRGLVAVAAREHGELLTPATDVNPQQERLLAAVTRMHQVPAGQLRQQQRVEPEDAPGITASIPLELFPEGLFADEPPAADGDATRVIGRRDDLAEAVDDPAPETEPANPAETGAAPNLTEVVLGLRRGRMLRNTFRNDPRSDATLANVREWASRILRRVPRSEVGFTEAREHQLTTPEQIDELIGRAHTAGEAWRTTSGYERAATLEQLAKALDANRARLIEVAVAETGLTFADLDHDVSHAIDLLNYDAHLARQLDRMQGAQFEPVGVCLGVPGWVMPVSSVTAIIAAALGAGSAVIVKPSPRSERTAAVLARVMWATDLATGLLQLAGSDHELLSAEQLGRELITDQRVERVLMQGSYATASHFLEWRPDLPLIGASGGKNSVIVTPSADYDQAARDIALSVTAAAGQHPLHPSTVILVGPDVQRSRFAAQLADALASLRVGYPSDASVHVGPLVQRANGRAYEMLTELAEGERWLVEPRSLDDTGRLWTPGLRAGVQLSSPQLRNDAAVPVVNLLHADNLDAAIAVQNEIDYGHGAGLFSLDRTEIAHWVQRVDAGNLFVNRDVVDARVQRQPSGGWKRSMIGTKLKSGGPNTLLHIGRWRPSEQEQSQTLHLRGLEEPTARLIEALQPSLSYDEFEMVRRTALSCQIAWNEEFGEVVDVTNLPIERNLLRYRPVDCLIRVHSDATATQLGQVLVAASAARAPIHVSTARALTPQLLQELVSRGGQVQVEGDAEFLERMRGAGLRTQRRLRLLGGSRSELVTALKNAVDIAVFSDDVTQAGRLEMLPFLREQTISITAHRFGYRDDRVHNLFPHELVADHSASAVAAPLRRPEQ